MIVDVDTVGINPLREDDIKHCATETVIVAYRLDIDMIDYIEQLLCLKITRVISDTSMNATNHKMVYR